MTRNVTKLSKEELQDNALYSGHEIRLQNDTDAVEAVVEWILDNGDKVEWYQVEVTDVLSGDTFEEGGIFRIRPETIEDSDWDVLKLSGV